MLQWLPIALRTKPRLLTLVHKPCGDLSAFWFILLHSLLHSHVQNTCLLFAPWTSQYCSHFRDYMHLLFLCLELPQTFMSLPAYHSAFNAKVSASSFLLQPPYLEIAPPSLLVILPYLIDFRIIEIIFQCICLYMHCFISPELNKM